MLIGYARCSTDSQDLTVTKLDRLARSLPDARDIVEELTAAEVKLNIGASLHGPNVPIGRLLFNVLAMIAEFEADLIRMRTREGMKVAKAKGRLRGKPPKLSPTQEPHLVGLYPAGQHTTAELAELSGPRGMKNPDAAPLIAPAVTTATVASHGRSHASASTCGVARVMPTCPAPISSVEVAAEDFPPGSPTSRYASPIQLNQ